MDSEKVAVTVMSWATPVAPLAGVTEVTVGRVVSEVLPVMKVHPKGVAALPGRSRMPDVILAV
jgi:hypothetical protein